MISLETISFNFFNVIITILFIFLLFIYFKKIKGFKYAGYILFSLRMLVLFLLLLLLFNPNFNIISNSKYRPKISFFIDNSQSMNLSIDKKKAIEHLDSFVNFFNNGIRFDYFLLGDSIRQVDNYNNITFKDELTNIDASLRYMNRLDSDGFILISDGIQNSGNENLILPDNRLIHSIGVGKKDISFNDLLIENVEISKVNNESIEFDIKINNNSNNDYNGLYIEISNDLGKKIIDKVNLEKGNYIDNRIISVPLEYLSSNNFFIIESIPEEDNINNNIYRFDIEKNILLKDNILLISGFLSNNSKKIKQIFLDNKNTTITHFYKTAGSLWNQEFDLNYQNYNTIIFDQFPVSKDDLVIYNEITNNEDLNFIFFIGPNIYEYNDIYYSLIEEFDYDLNISKKKIVNSFLNKNLANSLYPIRKLIEVFPNHDSYLEVYNNNNNLSSALSYSNNNVMIDYFNNIMFVFIPDLMNLSNLVKNLENVDVLSDIVDYYYNIFINGNSLELFSNKYVYDLREESKVYYNNKLDRKIDNIFLSIFNNENNLIGEYPYNNIIDDNLYVFDLNIINEGDYSAQLNVELSNGIIMESNILNLKFIISSSEYKNSSLNDILLKNIAYNSNGKYYKIDNIDSLIQFYDKESYFKLNKFRFNVFYFHSFWFIIIFALIVEWIIRRNKGLL